MKIMKRLLAKKFIVILFLTLTLFSGSVFLVFAQTDREEERAALEAELERLEREIAEASRSITATEAEKQSLQYQINRIQGEINHLTAQINRNRLLIQNLGLKIADTQGSIITTTEKIEQSKEELSEMLRVLNSESRVTPLEMILAEDNLSAVFTSLNSLERLSQETKNILDEVRELKWSLQGYKDDLETDKERTERVAKIQEAQKAEEEAARRERERLYGMTEEEYQRQLVEKQNLEKEAEKIREQIFRLVGIPEVEMPTFGEALDIAKWVQGITGIRPAFLLSIIMQESALGRNVGQCYLVDTTSGQSRNINTGRIYARGIHPTRDIPPFLSITRELGRNPLQTPVSCTMILNGAEFGYGGAMGPAQFIPSTWNSVNVRPRVTSILGREPDPWRIEDSFLASAIYLSFRGGGPSNELAAAAGYFGQSGLGYESSVMRRATCIQTFIDHGTMEPYCSTLVFMP
jgi:peptidoglycan hydrolase CwlO-like protein